MQINVTNPNLRMALELVTAPANPPLFLADVKDHLRVLSNDEDQLILGLMEVVRQRLDGRDGYLGRALLTQTWDCWIDWNFPPDICPIEMQLAPLQSVTFIKYIDPDGNQQTVDASVYTVDTKSTRSRILTAYNQYWPPCRFIINAVQIRGIFGYGATPNDVPQPIRQAMLMMIGHLYENREQSSSLTIKEIPYGVDHLLANYRLGRF